MNTGPISAAIRECYAAEGAEPTKADIERIEAMGIRCITGDFIAEGDLLRHAPDRVTEALLTLPCAPLFLEADSAPLPWAYSGGQTPCCLPDGEATILHNHLI